MREQLEELRARWVVANAAQRQALIAVATTFIVGVLGLLFAYLEARVKRSAIA